METSPERSFPLIGDCVGCESYVEVMPLIGCGSTIADSACKDRTTQIVTKSRRVTKTNYPPPIPLLARTGNLHARMPWVLRRHYTSDGRLILREERVRYHEYFRAHRSGGRLTLQLVPLEDNVFDLPIVDPDGDDDENNVSNSYLHSKEDIYQYHEEEEEEEKQNDEDDNIKEHPLLVSEFESTLSDISGAISGEWKCSCKTVSPSSSCIFGMPVHSLGPVIG